MAHPIFTSFSLIAIAAVAAACSGEGDTHYGPPGGLRNATPPAPTSTSTATATATLTASPPPPPGGGGDAGGAGAGDSAVAASCAVSFSAKIYPNMQAAGPWKCSSALCHGGGTAPQIDPNSATAAYASLAAYSINGKLYFNAATTDPAQSSFECNLKGACGAAQMPIPGNGVTAVADFTDVETWLKCGSPNN